MPALAVWVSRLSFVPVQREETVVVKPRMPAPELDLPLVGGGRWRLAEQEPAALTLVLFYRGLHCPICRGYLRQLERMLDEFAAAGVTSVVAVSGDDRNRAERTADEWGLSRLPIAYGQSVESMREWGLFVSKGLKEAEPEVFAEPGLFLVQPDGTVYAGVINTMPFGRPHLDDILSAVNYVREHDYPARGEA